MMDFDRAMNVRVNGKEVNRFAINGVTIWEKYTPASILLTSDKSYASEGDTINLTATVNDKFNRPCPNKNVDFYICDQLIQSVEEPYEATREYFLSEGDFTNKSIEFTVDESTVDAISGGIYILCEADTLHPFFRMTGLQVGDIVKITDDGILVKGYVNDTLTYTANHINNPGRIGFYLPNGATLTFSHFTEKGDVFIDSDMTDDTGVASVSYLVKDTNTLNIKAKSSNISQTSIINWINIEDTITINTDTYVFTEITSNTPNWKLTFDYYPTDIWEWLRVYVNSLEEINPSAVVSSSYDNGNYFGLTDVGYNKWIHITLQYENGILTIKANSKTGNASFTISYPINLRIHVNRNGTMIKNIKLMEL